MRAIVYTHTVVCVQGLPSSVDYNLALYITLWIALDYG